MQRAPAVMAFLLFLTLCASITYWLLQWMAPSPRPVAAPPQTARALPPVAAAANLFGGRAQASGMANVQLKGIIRAASPQDSSAIIAVEGKPARALQANAEVTSGLRVKAIHARSVVLSDRGAERELSLPAFAAQEGAMSNVPGRSPESPPAMPPMPQASPPPQVPAPQQATGPSTGVMSASSGSAMPNAQPAQAGQHAPAISLQPSQSPARALQR